MSGKNTKASQRRAAKAKQRQRKIKRATAIRRNNVHLYDSGMNRKNLKLDGRKITNRLKGEDETLTNESVLKGLRESTTIVVPVHGAVEVLSRLESEDKVDVSEHEELISEFDRLVVRFIEDINVIATLINSGSEPADYAELLLDTTYTLTDLFEETIPELMEKVLKPLQAVIEIAVSEYRVEGESDIEFSARMHNERCAKVVPKYKTTLEDSAESPEPLVIEDVEEAGPTEC